MQISPVSIGVLVCVLSAPLLTGCGDSPEEAYREAGDQWAVARRNLDGQEADLAAAEEELQALRERVQQELDEAEGFIASRREGVEVARTAFLETERRLNGLATDELIFRSLQQALLEDGTLRDTAISARVQKGIVYLSGEVSEDGLRMHAESIAGETPGVRAVENHIVLDLPEAPEAG